MLPYLCVCPVEPGLQDACAPAVDGHQAVLLQLTAVQQHRAATTTACCQLTQGQLLDLQQLLLQQPQQQQQQQQPQQTAVETISHRSNTSRASSMLASRAVPMCASAVPR